MIIDVHSFARCSVVNILSATRRISTPELAQKEESLINPELEEEESLINPELEEEESLINPELEEEESLINPEIAEES
ncbi:hypothetical protein CRE_00561 [Caenorhabditis remanei]|uniref:Uncharacterized protein n=1 Tax=Caenorhabditis remanei TaxID=31234 RepID=E3LD43_CAERE|nr:hypothetical protein CRE_00561 [Caenorhabditis remanei]